MPADLHTRGASMLPFAVLLFSALAVVVSGDETGWHYGAWNSSRCLQTYDANTHLHEVPTFSRLPGFHPSGHRTMLSHPTRVITPEVCCPDDRLPGALTCRLTASCEMDLTP